MLPLKTLICLILLAGLSVAQPPKKDGPEKFEPAQAAGAGQKYLAAFVGDWDVEKSFFPRQAGAELVKMKGTCKQELIHNGHFLKSEFTFSQANGTTMTGTGTIGFEAESGLFTSTWTDSRQTRMSIRRSKEKFDGKQIVLFGVAFEEVKDGRQSKTLSTVSEEGKKIVHKQYSIVPGSPDRMIMQLEMTKKNAK